MRRIYGLGLLAYAIAFTFVYFHLKNSVYFQVFVVMYALSVLALVIMSYKFAAASGNATLIRLVKLSAGVYIGGFLFLWIPEHLLCVLPSSDSNRPPIVEAIQLHAWFHITSTVGPYAFLLFALLLKHGGAGAELRGGPFLPFVHIPSAPKGQ